MDRQGKPKESVNLRYPTQKEWERGGSGDGVGKERWSFEAENKPGCAVLEAERGLLIREKVSNRSTTSLVF